MLFILYDSDYTGCNMADPYLKEYSEGVREIEICLYAMIAKAKQTTSNLFMAFLEFEDPYYNVAHTAVMQAIQGLPMPMATLVKQFVMNGQEYRRSGHGIMNSRECEMSRMVLALCMNSVIAAVDQSKGFPLSANQKIACKAFVEKLVLIATTEEDMKENLKKVGDAYKAIGLETLDVGHSRYVAITFNNKQMSVKNDLDFKLAEQEIRGVQRREVWQFLGKKFEVK